MSNESSVVDDLKPSREYKKPYVQLTGEDGNAFAILGKVKRALKQAGHADMAEEFYKKATSGDYNRLLACATEYVDVG